MTSTPSPAREERFLRLIRGESSGILAGAARLGLSAASAGYGLAIRARNLAYDRGGKAVLRAAVPVVSIGNLTVGGTGKTPLVEWVARWYRLRGVRVAILSRGYSRGEAEGRNDEALVLEENLADVPHLQSPDRVASARVAVEELETELIVLDDGFQHRRLARDLDIVLLDALEPFGLDRLLPRGLLREPVTSLRRAGLVVVSRSDLIERAALDDLRARAEKKAGKLRWVLTRHEPIDLIGTGVEPEHPAALAGRKVAAFCGIGNPKGFRRTIEPLCGSVVAFRIFPDHHPYTGADVADLTAWARSAGADLALTTQKDLVKLRAANLADVPLRALRIGLSVGEGRDLLESSLAALIPSRTLTARGVKDDP